MKEFWKKIDSFMLKYGGYTLLIATVATVAFFAVLQWANNYVKEETGELEIHLAEDGKLSVDYNYDDKDNIYILWETDGGHINASYQPEEFVQQDQDKENSLKYFCYSHSGDTAVWEPEDADGNNYQTATVRAILYEKEESNPYSLENYVTEIQITLTEKNGKIEKSADRLFSNPVRADGNENWSQIYCIKETQDYCTYRYRTGEKVDKDDILILYWESDQSILSETDYAKGFYPECSLVQNNQDKNEIKAATTISCKKGELINGSKIKASLIGEAAYKSDVVSETDKINQAELEIHLEN